MSAADAIFAGYRDFARFSGRTPRRDYWVFAVFLFVGTTVAFLIAPMVALIFVVASVVPGLAAATRRLHDVGRSGWWLALPSLIVPAWALIWIASAASALAVRQDPLDDSRYFFAASIIMLTVVTVFAF